MSPEFKHDPEVFHARLLACEMITVSLLSGCICSIPRDRRADFVLALQQGAFDAMKLLHPDRALTPEGQRIYFTEIERLSESALKTAR
jgi:hypothetical protein